MDKATAIAAFKRLVNQYGLQWTARVPQSAHELLAEINGVLSTTEKRQALGLRV